MEKHSNDGPHDAADGVINPLPGLARHPPALSSAGVASHSDDQFVTATIGPISDYPLFDKRL